MMNPALRPDAGLTEFLAARARAASDGRLALDVVVGAIVVILFVAWRPAGWVSLAGAATSLAAFGLWGIIDREIRERAQAPHARAVSLLAALRLALACLGFLAGVAALFGSLGIVLGKVIS